LDKPECTPPNIDTPECSSIIQEYSICFPRGNFADMLMLTYNLHFQINPQHYIFPPFPRFMHCHETPAFVVFIVAGYNNHNLTYHRLLNFRFVRMNGTMTIYSDKSLMFCVIARLVNPMKRGNCSLLSKQY